jgi:hypothetical protein
MGYYSTLSGRIQIKPPLRWAEFKDSDLFTRDNPVALTFDVDIDLTDTDTGVTEVRTAVAVVPAWEGQAKYYDLEVDLRAFLTAFGKGRTFVGHLVRSGEEQGDVERYSFTANGLLVEKAELRWPDGSVAEVA